MFKRNYQIWYIFYILYLYCLVSTLQNTQSENDQNIGDTCFAKLPFTCNPLYIYRTINGACTNLNFPYRGFVETALVRLLKAVNVGNV